MPCIVCGKSDTVRSHLIPAALIRDIAGKNSHAVRGEINGEGAKFTQSGDSDSSILCDEHESALSPADNYGIRWIRKFNTVAAISPGEMFFQAPNANPELLLKFACSVLWRHFASKNFGEFKIYTGPWEWALRSYIFDNHKFNPSLILARTDWMLEDVEIDDLVLPPFPFPMFGKRTFAFEVGGIRWIIKLDSRGHTPGLEYFRANGKKIVRVIKMARRDIQDEPVLMAILRNTLIDSLRQP